MATPCDTAGTGNGLVTARVFTHRLRGPATKGQFSERDVHLDNGLGDIGLPLKETGRGAQTRRALEKDNLGASVGGEDLDELSQERLGRERAAVNDACHHISGFDRAAVSIAKSNEILHGSDAEQKRENPIQIGFGPKV